MTFASDFRKYQMSFRILTLHGQPPGTSGPNPFYLYGVVARLAALAASCELEQGPMLAAEELACA